MSPVSHAVYISVSVVRVGLGEKLLPFSTWGFETTRRTPQRRVYHRPRRRRSSLVSCLVFDKVFENLAVHIGSAPAPTRRLNNGNGQKRELPALFWPKTAVPECKSDIKYCWPYLIGQPPFSPVFGQKRPGAPDYCYLAQLPPVFGHFMFPSGGPVEQTSMRHEKNFVFGSCDVETDIFLPSTILGPNCLHLSVWEMLRRFIWVQMFLQKEAEAVSVLC